MKTKRLYRTVAEGLLEIINSGRYAVGDRLPAERDLATEFKVSRPTMREAVIALEISGHVEVRKGSGVYVVEVDKGEKAAQSTAPDLDVGPFELTEARMLFEGEAAALAATMITDSDISQLDATIKKMQQENENHIEGELADKEFHMIIARATQNSAIATIIEDLWSMREKSQITRNMYKVVRRTGVMPNIDEHRNILKALADRDPVAARSAMRTHLSRVIDNLLEATEIEAVEEAVEEIKKQVSADRHRYTRILETD